ncbi:MAG: hypothetical protein AAGI70_04240 [Pseudomonadota bacterium]
MRCVSVAVAVILGVTVGVAGGAWAAARGFTISDFGAVASDEICVGKGRAMFERFGAEEVLATDWTVNAYGVGFADIDAAVVCSYGPGGQTQVSVIFHSWGGGDEDGLRQSLPEQLRPIWDGL